LLAFVAWQSGSGALTNVALDRALGRRPPVLDSPAAPAGHHRRAPPSLARLPMTPMSFAASYDEAGSEAEADDDEAGLNSEARRS
jgi:hypothetical protein